MIYLQYNNRFNWLITHQIMQGSELAGSGDGEYVVTATAGVSSGRFCAHPRFGFFYGSGVLTVPYRVDVMFYVRCLPLAVDIYSHVYGLGRSVLRQDEGTGGIDAMVALDGYSGRDGDLVQHFAGFGRCRKFQTDLRHSTVGIGKDVVGEKHFTGDIVDGDVFAEAGVS